MKRVLWTLVAGIVIGALVSCSNPMWGGGGSPSPSPSPAPDSDIASWFEGIYLDLLDRERNGTMGAIANCQFVCDAINAKWNKSIVPVPGTELQPANCKYLLSMIDQYVNDGISSYGTSSFATEQIIDTLACDQTIGRLGAPFLISGNYAAAYYYAYYNAVSLDGVSWQMIPNHDSHSMWIKGAYGNNKYVLVSSPSSGNANRNYYTKTSSDGITWTSPIALPFPLTNSPASINIIFGNGVFVITYSLNLNGVYTLYTTHSVDGVNWASPSFLGSNISGSFIEFGNGKFVIYATGVAGGVNTRTTFHSVNGQSWVEVPLPSQISYFSIFRFLGGKFVGVYVDGVSTAISFSSDCVNWSTTVLPYRTYPDTIIFGGGVYLLACTNSSPPNSRFLIRSVDLINWTNTSFSYSTSIPLIYGNGIFIRPSLNPYYSTDMGLSWQQSTLGITGRYGSVSGMFSKGRFVLFVASSQSQGQPSSNKAAYSSDGINWTQIAMPVPDPNRNDGWQPISIKGL